MLILNNLPTEKIIIILIHNTIYQLIKVLLNIYQTYLYQYLHHARIKVMNKDEFVYRRNFKYMYGDQYLKQNQRV